MMEEFMKRWRLCIRLPHIGARRLHSPTDGVVYVAPTEEVWVTTPSDKSIRIVDSKTMGQEVMQQRKDNRGDNRRFSPPASASPKPSCSASRYI
jgi:hypothetical protein